jgi:hypothetical protein
MNCSYCGAKIPEGDKTCPACGAAVSLNDVLPPPSPYFEETVGSEPAPVPPTPPEPDPVMAAITSQIPVAELKTVVNDRSNWAIASLVLGLVGLVGFIIPGVCTILSSVPAIVLGVMSLKSQRRNMAIGGIVLGIVEILALIVIIILFGLALAMGGIFQNK